MGTDLFPPKVLTNSEIERLKSIICNNALPLSIDAAKETWNNAGGDTTYLLGSPQFDHMGSDSYAEAIVFTRLYKSTNRDIVILRISPNFSHLIYTSFRCNLFYLHPMYRDGHQSYVPSIIINVFGSAFEKCLKFPNLAEVVMRGTNFYIPDKMRNDFIEQTISKAVKTDQTKSSNIEVNLEKFKSLRGKATSLDSSKDAIVLVVDRERNACATGFFFGEEGYIFTVAHVLSGNADAILVRYLRTDRYVNCNNVEINFLDYCIDIALIKINHHPRSTLGISKFIQSKTLMYLGFRLDSLSDISLNSVEYIDRTHVEHDNLSAQVSTLVTRDYIRFRGWMAPGSCGGPILDDDFNAVAFGFISSSRRASAPGAEQTIGFSIVDYIESAILPRISPVKILNKKIPLSTGQASHKGATAEGKARNTKWKSIFIGLCIVTVFIYFINYNFRETTHKPENDKPEPGLVSIPINKISKDMSDTSELFYREPRVSFLALNYFGFGSSKRKHLFSNKYLTIDFMCPENKKMDSEYWLAYTIHGNGDIDYPHWVLYELYSDGSYLGPFHTKLVQRINYPIKDSEKMTSFQTSVRNKMISSSTIRLLRLDVISTDQQRGKFESFILNQKEYVAVIAVSANKSAEISNCMRGN